MGPDLGLVPGSQLEFNRANPTVATAPHQAASLPSDHPTVKGEA